MKELVGKMLTEEQIIAKIKSIAIKHGMSQPVVSFPSSGCGAVRDAAYPFSTMTVGFPVLGEYSRSAEDECDE